MSEDPTREQPIKASELVRNAPRTLTRYAGTRETLTELSGLIDDVRTIDRNDAWIVVRPVDGLPDYIMATATIASPRTEIDEALERAGRHGRITLVGMAVATTDQIAKLRMTEVQTVNGIPTAKPARPSTPRPTPTRAARRWWQWWQNDETGQDANAQA